MASIDIELKELTEQKATTLEIEPSATLGDITQFLKTELLIPKEVEVLYKDNDEK
jgi:hypothetical protein